MKPDMAVKEVLIGKYCHVQVSSVHSHVIHSLPTADADVVVVVLIVVDVLVVVVLVDIVDVVVAMFRRHMYPLMPFISYFCSCRLYCICLWSSC